ncbi:MAG: ADP/ATP-dependent (S)-NAD(P)H-hydrate dehydratase [Patescibacteria group bacterium]
MGEKIKFNASDIKKLRLVRKKSHKGDNGKVLVIGGSTLFHSASIWAAELLAHFVDLVFYFSPAHTNEEILLKSKIEFRNGIIISQDKLLHYIAEADVVLIGPGMCRRSQPPTNNKQPTTNSVSEILLGEDEGELTHLLVNKLLRDFPQKKWVIDAGALQEVELGLIPKNSILTPHWGEYTRLFPQFKIQEWNEDRLLEEICQLGTKTTEATWLLKHQDTDFVFSRSTENKTRIEGGNEGLIKGGTGDLLSALVAAFFVKNDAILAASSASFILKAAADRLYKNIGPFYTTTEVLQTIPGVLWDELGLKTQS